MESDGFVCPSCGKANRFKEGENLYGISTRCKYCNIKICLEVPEQDGK